MRQQLTGFTRAEKYNTVETYFITLSQAH